MPVAIDRSLRLPDNQYFPVTDQKSGIAIHHTVGGSARSTFNWWRDSQAIVGTSYIIGRDGTVFEVFDPRHWAWQFGLKWPSSRKTAFERRHIGIELASEGGLIEHNGNLYCFDRISPRTLKDRAEAFDYGQEYRGYRYFDRYEPAQMDSLVELINDLCADFGISKEIPGNHFDYYGEKLVHFKGIIGHTMVRRDKSDPAPDANLWQRIIDDCGVQTRDINLSSGNGRRLTQEQIESLFEDNMKEINKMDIAAGSMVKGLIMELQRGNRKTYIRLRDAVPNGHVVYYDLVQGDNNLVFRIARALGFKTVTDDKLEVHHA